MTVCFINFSRHSITFHRGHDTGLIILIQNSSQIVTHFIIKFVTYGSNHLLVAKYRQQWIVLTSNSTEKWLIKKANMFTVNTAISNQEISQTFPETWSVIMDLQKSFVFEYTLNNTTTSCFFTTSDFSTTPQCMLSVHGTKTQTTCLWPPYEIGRPLYFCPVVTIFLSIYLIFLA